jgi:hypothetical protein
MSEEQGGALEPKPLHMVWIQHSPIGTVQTDSTKLGSSISCKHRAVLQHDRRWPRVSDSGGVTPSPNQPLAGHV